MDPTTPDIAPQSRLIVFGFSLLLLVGFEWLRRCRDVRADGLRGAAINIAHTLIGNALNAVLLPVAAVGAALYAADAGLGLLRLVSLDPWMTLGIAVVLLDLGIWAQHLMFHHVPLLWRLHAVHHSDPAMDVTTALRFHPLELVISLIIKIGLVILVGAPPAAVILFEILLSTGALFSHANIRLAPRLDGGLRLAIVTPAMHVIHHSRRFDERNCNFGFFLSVWDRLFGTYRAAGRDAPKAATTGLDDVPPGDLTSLWSVLTLPVRLRLVNKPAPGGV